jgi:hypothetical protein
MFVGTVAYDWSEIKDWFWTDDKTLRRKNAVETIKWIEDRIEQFIFNKNPGDKKRRLFTFIRESSNAIHGEEGFNKIAISNLAHCNEGNIENYLPQKVFDYCVRNSHTKYLLKEVEILNPTHVVLFSTSGKYTRYLPNVEEMGVKTMCFKHPSRANLNAFIEKLKNFVND